MENYNNLKNYLHGYEDMEEYELILHNINYMRKILYLHDYQIRQNLVNKVSPKFHHLLDEILVDDKPILKKAFRRVFKYHSDMDLTGDFYTEYIDDLCFLFENREPLEISNTPEAIKWVLNEFPGVITKKIINDIK